LLTGDAIFGGTAQGTLSRRVCRAKLPDVETEGRIVRSGSEKVPAGGSHTTAMRGREELAAALSPGKRTLVYPVVPRLVFVTLMSGRSAGWREKP
jgi:hypothetical protein